jgi:hypothetical protein
MITNRAIGRSWRFECDKPFTISGVIRHLDDNGGCWVIDAGRNLPFPMQLAGLEPPFQRDGLQVMLTVHMESGKTSDCVPFMLLFVDDLVPQ